ncbi:hypothetical protein BH10PSE15_BH10PSE15_02610 [soil metagenome]
MNRCTTILKRVLIIPAVLLGLTVVIGQVGFLGMRPMNAGAKAIYENRGDERRVVAETEPLIRTRANSIADQKARVNGFTLDQAKGGPDEDDADFGAKAT